MDSDCKIKSTGRTPPCQEKGERFKLGLSLGGCCSGWEWLKAVRFIFLRRLTATRRTWTWRRRRRRTEWNWSDRKCSSTSYHFSPQIFRIRNKRCFGHVSGLKSLIFWSTDYNVLSNELRISDLWSMMWYNQFDNDDNLMCTEMI